MKNILVIGAGLTGSTIARQLADGDCKVTVVDSRDHVAGNAHDQIDYETNTRFHTYGPHLFHTNNQKVVDFLSRFTKWTPYKHRVTALVGGHYHPFPPMYPIEPSPEVREKLLDKFFRPYTRKMWGMELDDMDPSVVARVPIKIGDYDLGYFKDDFQALPTDGYTAMVMNMLDHENIEVHLSRHIEPMSMAKHYDHVFNSAPIDVWYDYKFGALPYRSIKFHHQVVGANRVLPSTTVNYTDDRPYTRVTEWKNLPGHGENDSQTLLTLEEPCDYTENNHERYYPVKDLKGENRAIYKQYDNHTKNVENNMTFIGRCGRYVYIDMHMAVNQGLQIAKNHLSGLSNNELNE